MMDRRSCLRRLGIFFLLLAGPVRLSGQGAWPDAGSVAEAMQRANNYWITNNSPGNSGWARSAYFAGNQRACRVLGQRAYYNWAVAWGGANLWKIGPEGSGSADAYCCGQTYLDLYRLNPQTNFIADIKSKTDALVAADSTVTNWWWIDAFFMQAPVLARLGNLTGDTNYFQRLWLMYDDMKTRRGLFFAPNSLWFRDASFIYPAATTASGTNVFWSRGNGWVFAGLARVLQQMPADNPHYPDYVAMFQTMAPALKAGQSPDGLWRSSLYDTNQYPNPETSGTGFFTYGLAWGIRSGLLPAADYTNTVIRAWQGLTNLALNAAGRVGYVQNVGAAPAATTAATTTDFGVGAFLLAAGEIYLLAPDAPALRPWAGPDPTLLDADANGYEPVSLDASPTEIYRGTAVAWSWWEGTNQLATGITAQTNLPLGPHLITLKVLGSDGVTYTDSMTVTVSQPVVVAPVLKLRFDFEDSGTTTTDSVAGVGLQLVNALLAPADLHDALGTGVGGAGRALNLTSAAGQGMNGPLAFTTNNALVNFGTQNAFTLTLWIKPSTTLLTGGFPRFFSLGTNGLTDRGVTNSLQLLSNGNFQSGTSAQGFINTTQTSTSAFGALDMPVNQWSFLALTYDGSTLNFYGGSETNPVSLQSSAAFSAGPVTLNGSFSLMLGNRLARDRAFRGWLDAVRFYQEAAPLAFLERVRQAAVAPPLIAAAKTGANLRFRADTRLGLSYLLQSATNLTPPVVWTPVMTNQGSGGTVTNVVPLDQSTPKQFFRYVVQ